MNSTDSKVKMASKSTRADRRSRWTPKILKVSELLWGEATRTRLLMAKSTPSLGWPMRTDTSRPLLTCPLHLPSKKTVVEHSDDQTKLCKSPVFFSFGFGFLCIRLAKYKRIFRFRNFSFDRKNCGGPWTTTWTNTGVSWPRLGHADILVCHVFTSEVVFGSRNAEMGRLHL